MLGNYVPDSVEFSLFGIQAEGFAEDSAIRISRDSVGVSLRRAMDGSTTAKLDKYVPYRVSVFLQNTSPTNDWFHLVYKMYETYGADFKMPLLAIDKSGQTKLFATDVVFEKVPDTDLDNKIGTSEWVFICVQPTFTKGGNVSPDELIETLQLLEGALSIAGMFGINFSNFESKIRDFGASSLAKLKQIF